MGDFHQNGVVTTLHNLTRRPIAEIEAELSKFSLRRPMCLVLPSLFSELEGPALGGILDELSKAHYLGEIVIGLDNADEAQYRYALDYFSRLPHEHRVLWNDGPRLQAVQDRLREEGLAPEERGKGYNVWYCFGYVLACRRVEAVGLHDCDILTYTRELPARLLYPIANPAFQFQFCKGYYPRVSDGHFHGRVSRLLVTPLIRALKRICREQELLDYLDCFRYALAGEFSLRREVLNNLRIPSDWGLEVGTLLEMRRNFSVNHICQVDIADNYDHKHQSLSADDSSAGLSKMSTEICKAVFHKLATTGEVFSTGTFRTVKATYYRLALDMVESYNNDAQMNGLSYHRHTEEQVVELFAENIMAAGRTFLENPMDTPFIPSWNRVRSALPDILDQLREAVEQDHEEFRVRLDRPRAVRGGMS